jgi:hypothetical protein
MYFQTKNMLGKQFASEYQARRVKKKVTNCSFFVINIVRGNF